jgi:GntR family transcriptional repressor for pyruvate dehydrogenase complex
MGMGLKQVDRSPVYVQVSEQIREAILRGEFAPGSQLPTERELAERLGVGRASVREALRSLQAQGLVEGTGRSPARMIVGGASATAAKDALLHLLRLQRVSLDDLIGLRCLIEGEALSIAAIHHDDDDFLEPRQALQKMSEDGVELEAFEEADIQFHISLVRIARNDAMHLVMQVAREAMQRYLLDALRARPDPVRDLRKLASQHRAILEAVEAADAPKAAELVRAHITDFYHPSEKLQKGSRTQRPLRRLTDGR